MLERFHCQIVNDENEEGSQGPDIPVVMSHRSADLSSISCSLELLRVAHNYGVLCFCVNFLFLFKSGSPEHYLKMFAPPDQCYLRWENGQLVPSMVFLGCPSKLPC